MKEVPCFYDSRSETRKRMKFSRSKIAGDSSEQQSYRENILNFIFNLHESLIK